MAAAAFRHICAAAGVEATVESAGLAAAEGEPMTPQAAFALRLRGVRTNGKHRSRPLTKELTDAADLVVVMTRGHLQAAQGRFSGAAAKMRLLMSFAAESAGKSVSDVADPFGGDSETYVGCLEMMWPALERLAAQMADGR